MDDVSKDKKKRKTRIQYIKQIVYEIDDNNENPMMINNEIKDNKLYIIREYKY